MGNGKADAGLFVSINASGDGAGAIDLNSDTEDPPSRDVAATFTEHTILRIAGLREAAALNGKCARVRNYVEGRDRYNVSLMDGKGETLKLVQPDNLQSLSLKEEVEELLKEVMLSDVSVAVATQVILRLRVLPIDLVVLKETKIGKLLNDLTKAGSRLANDDVFTNLAKNLVRRWREQFSEAQGKKRDREDSGRESAEVAAPATSSVARPAPHLMTVPGREDSPGQSYLIADRRRCLARIWNEGAGGQCTRLKEQNGDLCGNHQSMYIRDGFLPHGRIDGVIPDKKRSEYESAQLAHSTDRLSPAGRRSLTLQDRLRTMGTEVALQPIPPMASEAEAQKMVEGMRNAPTDRMRLSMMVAVDRTPLTLMPAFISSGGVSVLEKWIRERPELRFPCLVLLQQLPLGKPGLISSLTNTVTDLLKKDLPADIKLQAQALLTTLHNGPPAQASSRAIPGSTTPVSEPAQPPVKRPKAAQPEPQLVVKQVTATPPAKTQPKMNPVQSTPPARARPAAASPDSGASLLPADCPEEMRRLDPRIQAVLRANPGVISLLQKHPAYFKNFNKDSIARLGSLLRRSKDSQAEDEDSAAKEKEAFSTVTISNLPPAATEADVEALFDDICEVGSVRVIMPVESRKKRHVGIAFVVVANPKIAGQAAGRLNGFKFRASTDPSATVTTIEAVVQRRGYAGVVEDAVAPPVTWKTTDELWEVRMYNKEQSVQEGCQVNMAAEMRMLPCPTAESRSEFQEAARKEREEQARLVKESQMPAAGTRS